MNSYSLIIMANFLFMVSENNWKIIDKNHIMGISGRWAKNLFPKLKNGDNCIIYVTRISVISGAFKIISKNLKNRIKWSNGSYDFLFKLEPIIIPKKPLSIKDHIENLKFIKNKNQWFQHFRSPKEISDEDFKYILDQIKK